MRKYSKILISSRNILMDDFAIWKVNLSSKPNDNCTEKDAKYHTEYNLLAILEFGD